MHKAFLSARPAVACRRHHVVPCALEAPSNGAKPSINFDDLVEVIKAVDTSDVVELELKGKKFSMCVRKPEALKAAEPMYVQAAPAAAPTATLPMPETASAPPPAAPSPPPSTPSAPPPPPPAPVAGGVEVVSPMSGTLYRSPAPGEPPFVKEGDKIVKGQTICIIERLGPLDLNKDNGMQAMKLMNEIEAETSGTLTKFVADANKMISAGEVIVLIEP